MKEYVAETGGRYTYSDDILNLQELALSMSTIFDGCSDFIISGCAVEGSTISPGYVWLGGKVRPLRALRMPSSHTISTRATATNRLSMPMRSISVAAPATSVLRARLSLQPQTQLQARFLRLLRSEPTMPLALSISSSGVTQYCSKLLSSVRQSRRIWCWQVCLQPTRR